MTNLALNLYFYHVDNTTTSALSVTRIGQTSSKNFPNEHQTAKFDKIRRILFSLLTRIGIASLLFVTLTSRSNGGSRDCFVSYMTFRSWRCYRLCLMLLATLLKRFISISIKDTSYFKVPVLKRQIQTFGWDKTDFPKLNGQSKCI